MEASRLIEVKTGSGRLSKEQAAVIDNINADGGVAFCVRSVDDLRDWLIGLGVMA